MLLGIGLFGGITATVTSYLIEQGRDEPAGRSLAGELEALAVLRDRDQLTEQEFALAKARAIGGKEP